MSRLRMVLFGLLFGGVVLVPTPASAWLPITSTAGGTGLAIYALSLEDEDENKNTFLYSGLGLAAAGVSTSGGYSTLYVVYGVGISGMAGIEASLIAGTALPRFSAFDKMEALEQELMFGEGPLLDAICLANNMDVEDVRSLYEESMEQSSKDVDPLIRYEIAEHHFTYSLLKEIPVTHSEAYGYLKTLNKESQNNNPAQTLVFIQALSEFSGINQVALKQTLNTFFDQYFATVQEDMIAGDHIVFSQNDALSHEPNKMLRDLATFITMTHSDVIDEKIKSTLEAYQQRITIQ